MEEGRKGAPEGQAKNWEKITNIKEFIRLGSESHFLLQTLVEKIQQLRAPHVGIRGRRNSFCGNQK
jgi:hypothetical protein